MSTIPDNSHQLPIATYSPTSFKRQPGAALLTWMSFPAGLTLWLVDDEGVRSTWVNISHEELKSHAQSFARLCADPSSDTTLIDAERMGLEHVLAQVRHNLGLALAGQWAADMVGGDQPST